MRGRTCSNGTTVLGEDLAPTGETLDGGIEGAVIQFGLQSENEKPTVLFKPDNMENPVWIPQSEIIIIVETTS